MAALRARTAAFSGQAALVQGDSHVFKVDQPLKTDDGRVLVDFTRVETPGASWGTHGVSRAGSTPRRSAKRRTDLCG